MLGAMPSSRNALARGLLMVAAMGLATGPAHAENGRWPDPARLSAEVAAFAHADSVAPPPAGAVLFAGSSSIRMWHPRLARDMAPLTVVPRGFGGSTMRDLLLDLDPLVIAPHPRAVVLYEGDNDLVEGLAPGTIFAVFDSLITRLHAALPGARVYVLAVKPSPARRAFWPSAMTLNASFREACARDSLLAYIDVASPMLDTNGQPRAELFGPDSLHMNDAGYDLWHALVAAPLQAREMRYEAPHPRPSAAPAR
jgi:lysophospholipase L1-like esterase